MRYSDLSGRCLCDYGGTAPCDRAEPILPAWKIALFPDAALASETMKAPEQKHPDLLPCHSPCAGLLTSRQFHDDRAAVR